MALKTATMHKPSKLVGLPVAVTSPADIGRLSRELEQLEDHFQALRLRKPGQEVRMPKTSHLLELTVEFNHLSLLQPADRARLAQLLTALKQRAPVINLSFSVDPSARFMESLVGWLRREIHPLVLVTVGLQPNIGAGCIVRTTNKQFDLSLRQDFAGKRDLLLQRLHQAVQS